MSEQRIYRARPTSPHVAHGDRLTEGLTAAWSFHERGTQTVRDLVGDKDLTIGGGSWHDDLLAGGWGYQASDRELIRTAKDVCTGNRWTLALVAQIGAPTTTFRPLLRLEAADAEAGIALEMRVRNPSTQPSVRLARAGDGYLTAIIGEEGDLPHDELIVWVVSFSPDAMRAWVNGKHLGEATGSAAGLELGGYVGLSLGHYAIAGRRYLALYEWDRPLSDAEVRRLSTEPFAPLRRGGGLAAPTAAGALPVVDEAAGVTLTQAGGEAAMDDRGSTGLAVQMEAGGHGRYLERDLGAVRSKLSTRFMLNTGTATGGDVAVLRGVDEAGERQLEVIFETETRRVRAEIVDGEDELLLSSWPLNALPWHAVELSVDAASGEARLFVDGLEADATAEVGDVAVRRLWIGGPWKQAAVTGTLYLDEWAAAADYVGPVVVEPTSEYADDPRRWLVVYNRDSAASSAWAEHYRQTHAVPFANLLGLDLSEQEVISEAVHLVMAAEIEGYLQRNGLAEQVLGVLCGHGVPGVFERAGTGERECVSSHLHVTDGTTGAVSNPLAGEALTRSSEENLAGVRLTARIDGPSEAFSEALVDRAAAVTAQPLREDDAEDPGRSATIWLDPHGGAEGWYILRTPGLLAWAEGLERQRLRLPIEMTDDAEEANPTFSAIHNDGFFWGWDQPTVDASFFGEPAGRRVFCMQLGFTAATGATLRDEEDTGWVMRSLEAGYAAAGGSVRAHSASHVPLGERFFAALGEGWSLGEAWLAAQPWLRTAVGLVGDPLMRVTMPLGGWNVYRGEEELSAVALDEPIALLREPARRWEIDAPHQPSEGETAVYVVRHVDEAGREEKGVRHVRVRREEGALVSVPWQPSWPTGLGWRPTRTANGWRIEAVWPGRLAALGVASAAVERETQSGGVETIAEAQPTADASRLRWDVQTSGERERFRVAVTATDGGKAKGPWSAWLRRDAAELVDLTLI